MSSNSKLKEMNKQEAYQAMRAGHKVKHVYYDKNEYAFINKKGEIETEDGCIHGGQFDDLHTIKSLVRGWGAYDKLSETLVNL